MNSEKLCDTLQRFNPIFLAQFPDFPWLFETQVPWISLNLVRNELQGSDIFPNSKSRSVKNVQQGNLNNFKKILLMMYVYQKAAFTFYASFFTSSYDARWLYFNFTHILMNIVGSSDLHNSLQTFSIRTVWQQKLFRTFWSYTPHNVKQMECICKRGIKLRTTQYKTKTQYQEYTVH